MINYNMELVTRCKRCGLFILLVICVFTNTVFGDGVSCLEKDGLCGCVFKNGKGEQKMISMSALDKKGKPFFKDIPFGQTWLYSVNLCTGFTLGASCTDVTGCQVYKSSGKGFPIGKPGKVTFGKYTTDQPLTVTYEATSSTGYKRSMVIQLICTDNDESSMEVKDQIGNRYDIQVLSKSLCPQPYYPPSSKSNSGGLSTGSIIVIVFFVVLVIYLVSGILFMKYKKEATGKEVIPNVNFWSSLLGYIKDGCVFSGKKTKQLCNRARGEEYENI